MDILHFRASSVVLESSISRELSIGIAHGKITDLSFGDGESEGDSVFEEVTVYPGFIDVHTHGAVGVDVNEADADSLLEIAAFLARNGVTAWLPTLVPDTDERYASVISAIDEVMRRQVDLPVAQALGVHYEGVFASEAMCGALRPEYFKRYTGTEIDDLPHLEKGVHMMTLAPEIEGGVDLIAELRRLGWIVSLGHTRADVATLDAARVAGARHMTHFFNAMTGIHHRDLGVAGWGLANGDVSFDIIADGIHVCPEMLRLACSTKGPRLVSLISDSVAPTGRGDGDFKLWGETVSVREGRTQNEGGHIAGSVITMRDAVIKMLSLGFTPAETAQMASANPARLLGLDKSHGSIAVGKNADLVALDLNGNVKMSMIGGRAVPM